MKKRIYTILSALLVFTLLFFLVFSATEKHHDCEQSQCNYCVQIHEYEHILVDLSHEHSSIVEDCSQCDQIVFYQSKMVAISEHICHTLGCAVCHQIDTILKILKSVLLVALIVSAVFLTEYTFAQLFEKIFRIMPTKTLVALKVKLSN